MMRLDLLSFGWLLTLTLTLASGDVLAKVINESAPARTGASKPGTIALRLPDVLRSVERHYPLFAAVLEEQALADGRRLSRQGAFDLRIGAKNKWKPEGFYDTNQADVSINQATTAWGAQLYAGYRHGDGNFAIWDGGDLTNSGGEVRAGVKIPLLRDRSIDKRRAELRDAELDVAAARPLIDRQLLGFQRGATFAYWDWVATGMGLDLSRRLLDIAEQRQGQIRRRVERGALPTIDLTDNERLILERRVRLIDSERAFEQATNTLSLFLRDASGSPNLVQPARLPSAFPEEYAPQLDDLDRDIQDAMTQQPLLRALNFELEQAAVKLELAENRVLPGLSISLGGSRDLGAAAKNPDDKGPTVLEATIEFELPVQRREARGEIAQASAKLRQLKSELRFAEERVAADVRSAVIGLGAAYEQVDAAKRTRELAETLMLAEERKLDLGESNLINVNIRELQAFDAATKLIATQAGYFKALANYHFSLGDRLEA